MKARKQIDSPFYDILSENLYVEFNHQVNIAHRSALSYKMHLNEVSFQFHATDLITGYIADSSDELATLDVHP